MKVANRKLQIEAAETDAYGAESGRKNGRERMQKA